MSSGVTAAFVTRSAILRRIRQPRAEREQIPLDLLEHARRARRRRQRARARKPEPRVQLVDVAVGRDAADPPSTRACRRTARSRRCRRSWYRFSLTQLFQFTKPRMPLPEPGRDSQTASRCRPDARQRFRRRLLDWYRRNGRDLPWRKTSDPYHILVSEVMLQQTQVDRVLPKYHEWLDKYPEPRGAGGRARSRRHARRGGRSATTSARAGSTRSRASRSRATAASCRRTRRRCARSRASASTPAGAVLSFAFGQRAAILDTNVARVLFRIFVGRGDPKAHAMKRAPVGRLAHGAAASPRLRLQPGADGFRRHALHRAQAEVPDLPDADRLRGVSLQSGQRTCLTDRVVVTAAIIERRRTLSRDAAAARRAPRRALGVSGRQVRGRRIARRLPAAGDRTRSSGCDVDVGERDLRPSPTTTPTASSSCTSSRCTLLDEPRPLLGQEMRWVARDDCARWSFRRPTTS